MCVVNNFKVNFKQEMLSEAQLCFYKGYKIEEFLKTQKGVT